MAKGYFLPSLLKEKKKLQLFIVAFWKLHLRYADYRFYKGKKGHRTRLLGFSPLLELKLGMSSSAYIVAMITCDVKTS